jgi:hypothetical protein
MSQGQQRPPGAGVDFGEIEGRLRGQQPDTQAPRRRTATNPTTGERIEQMPDGSWRPIQ